jgi:hypothetical protein
MAALVAVTGQSLALGFGVTPEELPADYHPNPLVQILTPRGLEMMVPGVNTGTPNNPRAFGPEVGIAQDWTRDHPAEPLYIVKEAFGETGIAANPTARDWSPASHGDLFDTTTDAIARARALTGLPLSVVYWVQGHEDAKTAAAAGAYAANLADEFGRMRADWGDQGTRIVFAELPTGTGLPFADQVRAAQEAVAIADARDYLVSGDGLPLQRDGIHPTGAGEIELGDRLYHGAYVPPLPDYLPPEPAFLGWLRGLWDDFHLNMQCLALLAGLTVLRMQGHIE